MPIPFLLGGAAIAAAGIGVVTGAKGLSDLSDAKDIIEYSSKRIETKRQQLNALRTDANDELRNLGQLKVDIFTNQIRHVIEVLRQIGDPYSTLQDFNETLTAQELIEMKHAVNNALEIENGFLTGVTSGVLTGMGAYGAIGSFGLASTGTAISTLAGAASTNATLAWFGGGSLASGGLGMAGGTMVLSSIVAGPAIAITGLHIGGKGEEAMTQAKAFEARNEANIAEIEIMKVSIKAVTQNALEVQRVLLETVKRFEKVKVNDASDEEALLAMVTIGKSLKNILSQPIVNNEGKAINNIRSKCEGYLEI